MANRYYRLDVSFFMSDAGSNLLSIMARNHLWIRVLSAASIMEPEVSCGLCVCASVLGVCAGCASVWCLICVCASATK